MEPEQSATPDPQREEPAKKKRRTPQVISAAPTSPKMHQLIEEYQATHPEADDASGAGKDK